LVDIDDGYADIEVACHVVSLLESMGASGIILEDQKRPKRCGHLNDKQILSLDEFLPKLEKVVKTRKNLVVVARTDASRPAEITRRVTAFDEAGADWLLVDGYPISRWSRLSGRAPNLLSLITLQVANPSLSLTDMSMNFNSIVQHPVSLLLRPRFRIDSEPEGRDGFV
jgi:2-methylisocitrate lyase-like PEP mutase family enzyme